VFTLLSRRPTGRRAWSTVCFPHGIISKQHPGGPCLCSALPPAPGVCADRHGVCLAGGRFCALPARCPRTYTRGPYLLTLVPIVLLRGALAFNVRACSCYILVPWSMIWATFFVSCFVFPPYCYTILPFFLSTFVSSACALPAPPTAITCTSMALTVYFSLRCVYARG
jgi:hypothetical protein